LFLMDRKVPDVAGAEGLGELWFRLHIICC
jgi:hypothetical protein